MAENLDEDWDYSGMDWKQVHYQKRREKADFERSSGSSEEPDVTVKRVQISHKVVRLC